MRERASAELRIGGFTQAQLDTPVLDLSDLDPDDDRVPSLLVFFLVVSCASGASVARVRCAGACGPVLARSAREILGDACVGVDADNVKLMHYFDVSLAGPTDLDPARGEALAARLASVV